MEKTNALENLMQGKLPELPTSVSFDSKSLVRLSVALVLTAAVIILINKIVKGL